MPFCANRNLPGIYGFTNRSSTADENKEGEICPRGSAGNKKALKHGLYAYQTMLNGKGLDERTSLFKAMREKEQELVTALGGDPSPQEQVIIADCVKNTPAWIIT